MFSGRTVVLAPLSHGRIEQPDRPASMQLEPCCSPASHSTPAASAVVTMSAARFVDAEPMTSRAGGPHARHNADGALASRSTHDDSPFREARAHSGGPAISVGDTTIAAGRQRPESTRSIGAACPLGGRAAPLRPAPRATRADHGGPPRPLSEGRAAVSRVMLRGFEGPAGGSARPDWCPSRSDGGALALEGVVRRREPLAAGPSARSRGRVQRGGMRKRPTARPAGRRNSLIDAADTTSTAEIRWTHDHAARRPPRRRPTRRQPVARDGALGVARAPAPPAPGSQAARGACR